MLFVEFNLFAILQCKWIHGARRENKIYSKFIDETFAFWTDAKCERSSVRFWKFYLMYQMYVILYFADVNVARLRLRFYWISERLPPMVLAKPTHRQFYE